MNTKPNPVNQYHVPPMAKYKDVNVNLKNVLKAKSSDEWYKDKEKKKVIYVLCGSLLCVLIIGAMFAVPIAVSILLATTTTTASTSKTSSTTVVTTAISTSSGSNITNPTTTAVTASTTTVCPNMTCTFSSIASPMTITYGVEHLDINCTQTLSDMFIQIYVQRTVNATYANQYQTFWNLTTNQTYIETNSQIIYTWTLLYGQIIQGIGFPYFVEGQYFLPNINQTTSLDTYSATLTSICGHVISQTGTF